MHKTFYDPCLWGGGGGKFPKGGQISRKYGPEREQIWGAELNYLEKIAPK